MRLLLLAWPMILAIYLRPGMVEIYLPLDLINNIAVKNIVFWMILWPWNWFGTFLVDEPPPPLKWNTNPSFYLRRSQISLLLINAKLQNVNCDLYKPLAYLFWVFNHWFIFLHCSMYNWQLYMIDSRIPVQRLTFSLNKDQ